MKANLLICCTALCTILRSVEPRRKVDYEAIFTGEGGR